MKIQIREKDGMHLTLLFPSSLVGFIICSRVTRKIILKVLHHTSAKTAQSALPKHVSSYMTAPDESLLTEELPELESIDDISLDGKSFDGKSFDDKLFDGKLLDGKLLDGKLLDGKLLDGKLLDGKLLDCKLLDDKLLDDKLLDLSSNANPPLELKEIFTDEVLKKFQKEFKKILKNNHHLTLVDIESSNGDHVKVVL